MQEVGSRMVDLDDERTLVCPRPSPLKPSPGKMFSSFGSPRSKLIRFSKEVRRFLLFLFFFLSFFFFSRLGCVLNDGWHVRWQRRQRRSLATSSFPTRPLLLVRAVATWTFCRERGRRLRR